MLALLTKSVTAGDYEAIEVSTWRVKTRGTKSFVNLQRSLRASGRLPS